MKIDHPINITTPDYNQRIHEYFAWMRREAPVYKARMPGRKDAYLVTRYQDVATSLKDPRILKNPHHSTTESGNSSAPWIPKTFRPLFHNMLNTDEPDHRRLRNLVHKAFTPRMIAAMETRIQAISKQLLDKVSTTSAVDLIEAYAKPLPVTVIAEMIGIPKADQQKFSSWASSIVVNPTMFNMVKAVPAITAFLRYTRKLAEERRREPKDDLITALAQAEADGEQFSEDELVGMVFLLVVAGHETTVNLISNGILALLTHPEQMALLRSDYGLMETAVEELLRYDGPLQTAEMSFATEPITLHNVTIPKGGLILPAILSANRDEAVFQDADTLDITRTPNKHLAFGHGIHYCLGAPLARLEAKVAFCDLLERYPHLRLAVPRESLTYDPIMMVNRLRTLPLQLT